MSQKFAHEFFFDASHMRDSCPANGDLGNTTALDEMLESRAEAGTRNLIILILGMTHGAAQVTMRDSGALYVEAMVNSLRRHGMSHYLVVTSDLSRLKLAASYRPCTGVLRPRGICCGELGVGMDVLTRASPAWKMFSSHPYMLFLQRWALAARALDRGYNILSLDADMHLSSNPFHLVAGYARSFDILFQGDAGWPMRSATRAVSSPHAASSVATGHASPRTRGGRSQEEANDVPVNCDREPYTALPSLRDSSIASSTVSSMMRAVCGRTAAPALNTGFVWARAGAHTAALFNETVHTILRRLRGPPINDSHGNVHQARLWPQAVMNEVVYRRARLPWHRPAHPHRTALSGSVSRPSIISDDAAASTIPAASVGAELSPLSAASPPPLPCHPMDRDCLPWALPSRPDASGVWMPTRWWIKTPRQHSVWVASIDNVPDAASASGPDRAAEHHEEWRAADGGTTMAADEHERAEQAQHLVANTRLDTGARLALLPRTMVGRLCARRKLPLSVLTDSADEPPPVACEALRAHSLLGQRVQHLQFTNGFTRMAVFSAMDWWASAHASAAADARRSPFQALTPESGTRPRAKTASNSAAPHLHRRSAQRSWRQQYCGRSLADVKAAAHSPSAPILVHIGSAVAKNQTWLCIGYEARGGATSKSGQPAPEPTPPHPAGAAPAAAADADTQQQPQGQTCPCCWVAPAPVSQQLRGCTSWNANW